MATSHIPGTRQLSTSISDAVLAAVSFYCFYLVFPRNPLGSLGILLIGLAASAGVARFYGVRKAAKPHDLLTFASTTAGMLLLACGFLLAPNGYPDFQTALVVVAAITAAAYIAISQKPRAQEGLTLAFGFTFIGSALYKCILGQNWGGVAGVLIFTAIGLYGTQGSFKGVKKVDIFHYVLAGAIFLVAQALTQVW